MNKRVKTFKSEYINTSAVKVTEFKNCFQFEYKDGTREVISSKQGPVVYRYLWDNMSHFYAEKICEYFGLDWLTY